MRHAAREILMERAAGNVAKVLNDVVADASARMSANGTFFLHGDCATDLPAGLAVDLSLLRRLLASFVDNAMHFSSGGPMILRAVPCRITSGVAGVRFEICESAPIVTPEAQERLFARFFDDGPSVDGGSGSRLDIAACRAHIAALGGRIGLASAPERGTTLWFTIPCEAAIQQRPERLRILVVEDHEINQRVVRSVLERAGYDVTIADNGRLGLEAVQRERFDLVLMDIQMPDMDGPTTTRAIRSLTGAVSRLPIVALTANFEARQLKGYKAAGMDDCVTKPISPAKLLGVIGRLTAPANQLADLSTIPASSAAVATLPTSKPAGEPAPAPDPLIDEVRIARIGEAIGVEVLGELLSLVADEARRLAGAIGEAIAAGDWQRARKHAHTLKGMAGNMAASRVSRIARDIGRDMEAIGVNDHLARLNAAVEETSRRLDALADARHPVKAIPTSTGAWQDNEEIA